MRVPLRSGLGLGAVVSAALVLGILEHRHAHASADTGREPKKAASVFVRDLHVQSLYDVLSFPARVSPKVNTTILSENDGVVSKILVPLGQPVKRNQAVMMIEHTDPIYRYAPVRVLSPVAGIMSSVDVTEGTQVAKGQKLGLVTDPGKIRVELEVPAMDLGKLQRGLQGEFRLPGMTDPTQVRIAGVSPFVDPASGTAGTELEVLGDAKAHLALSPGMVGQVTFKTNEHQGIAVPDHCLSYRGDGIYVRLIEDGKSKAVKVQIGKKQRGVVEIVAGLADGQKLIERSSRYIADGEGVQIEGTE